MSKTLRESLRKTIAGVVAIATVLSISGVAALAPIAAKAAVAVVDGDTIKNPNAAGMAQFDVYIVKLVGTKKFKRLVLNPQVFNSYKHLSWSKVKSVDQTTMDSYTTSALVRVDTDPAQKVYGLVPSGDTGSKSWINVTADQFVNQAGADPDSIYTINSTDAGNYTAVADVTTVNDVKTFLTAGTLPSGTVIPTTNKVTVALAASNPAAGTLVTDGTNGSQSLAKMTEFTFTNGTSSPVKVNTLNLTRTGIGADADLSNVYLYNGNITGDPAIPANKLAEVTSISSRVYSFVNNSGLFTIPANSSYDLLVRADIVNSALSGKTYALGINAATDIVTDGATVGGTFPVTGNTMSSASVTDLGRIYVGNSVTAPSNVDPGVTGREIFRFSAQASNQNLAVDYIKFTNVGTTANTDIANLKLMDGSTQLGSTMANLAADNTATFDLSSSPLAINSGVNKSLYIVADVVGGTNRSFKMTIQRQGDMGVRDTNYGIRVKPYTNSSTNTFSAVQPSASTTVNTGTLTIGVDASSPSGNVALASTGITLAKLKMIASGEAIRVLSIPFQFTLTNGTNATDLKNVKLMLDGTQVGTTVATLATATAQTLPTTGDFGNSFIIPAGTTGRILSIVADIQNAAGTLGVGSPALTIQAQLNAGASNNLQGQVSLTSTTSVAATGRLLTVASGALSAAKNLAMNDGSASNPTAVKGATGVKIGSFVLTAGAGEGVSVSQIQLTDNVATTSLADAFMNLKLMMGSTQVGTTYGTLSATNATAYAFTPSTAIQIAAGQQVVFDVYADVKTGAVTTNINGASVLKHTLTTATGLVTSGNANTTGTSNTLTLQQAYIATSGTLAVAVSGDSPTAQQVVMGTTSVPLAKFKLSETSNAESLNISQLVVTDTDSATTYGSIKNIALLDGTTVLGTVASLSGTGTASFTGLSITVPQGGNKYLTVNGDVTAYPGATAAAAQTLSLASGAITGTGTSSGVSLGTSGASGSASAMTVVRTKVTVAKNSASPSGTSGKGTEQTIAIFDFSNSSNIGNYDAKISDLAVDVSGGGSWTTEIAAPIKVYKTSVNSANLLGQSANGSAGSPPPSVAFAGWTTGGDSNPVPNSLTDLTIAAGTTVQVYITANTNGAPTSGTLTATISAGEVKWEDGVKTGANAYTTVNSLPVSAGTLVF